MLYELVGRARSRSRCASSLWPATVRRALALSSEDIGWLAMLAIACTVIPQVWVIHVLRRYRPSPSR